MKKTNYTPQAGDVCEWNWDGYIREVMIIAPESFDRDGFYEAMDETLLNLPYIAVWHCRIDDLKLIYRP